MNTPDIFISYRRDNEPAFVGRLYDLLKNTFPRHTIFIDVDAIPPGANFVDHIVSRIQRCSVFLPIIGPTWISSTSRRLFDDEDVVRKEIEVALRSNCLIIPVKVNDTPLPLPKEVPESIGKLCTLNAVHLSHVRFHDDARPLIRAIKGVIKHPIHTHLTVAAFEAYEWGRALGKDVMEGMHRAVYSIMDSFSKEFIEIFLRETKAAIAERDALKLYSHFGAFSDAISDARGDLTKRTIDLISQELHPIISPNEQDHTLFVRMREYVEHEYDSWFYETMESLGHSVTTEIKNAGWQVEGLT